MYKAIILKLVSKALSKLRWSEISNLIILCIFTVIIPVSVLGEITVDAGDPVD